MYENCWEPCGLRKTSTTTWVCIFIGLHAVALSIWLLWWAVSYDIPATRNALVRWFPGVVKSAPGPELDSSIMGRQHRIATYLAKRYKQPYGDVRRYVNLAWIEAAKHSQVSPELILAVMQKESSLKHWVSSNYGGLGLMQVVYRWHPEKVAPHESLMDVPVNIRAGAQVLQEYLLEAQNLTRALVKYSGNARGYPAFVIKEKKRLEEII